MWPQTIVEEVVCMGVGSKGRSDDTQGTSRLIAEGTWYALQAQLATQHLDSGFTTFLLVVYRRIAAKTVGQQWQNVSFVQHDAHVCGFEAVGEPLR